MGTERPTIHIPLITNSISPFIAAPKNVEYSAMSENPLQHVFKIAPPVLFPEGEIFLSVASIDLSGKRIEWGVPGCLFSQMERILSKLRKEDIDRVNVHRKLAAQIDDLLAFKSRIVQWRRAVEFNYNQDEVRLLETEPAVYNRDVPKDSLIVLECKHDRFLSCFLTHPYCAAVIEGNEIASICWHGGNRALSIATKEKFRNMGFGSSCVRMLTRRSLAEGRRLSIGTEADNHPLIHIAIKVGYELTNKMYWISLPAKYRELIPSQVEAELSKARFDDIQR